MKIHSPMPGHAEAGGIRDLTPIGSPVRLPAEVSRPMVSVSLAGRLHLLATDWAAKRVLHVPVDCAGNQAGCVGPLPLANVEAIAVLGEELVIAGWSADSAQPVVLGASAEGGVSWLCGLPVEGSLAMVRLVPAAGRLHCLWSTMQQRDLVWVAVVERGRVRSPLALNFGDPSVELRVASMGDGMTLLRVHGVDDRIELVTITDGTVTRVNLAGVAQAVSPDIVSVEAGFAALFIGGPQRDLGVQRLDQALHPVGEREVLVRPMPGTRVQSARFISGECGYIAIACRLLEGFDGFVTLPGAEHGPNRRQATSSFQDYVCAYDGCTGMVGPIRPVTNRGVRYDACGWIRDTLLLLSDEQGSGVACYRGER